MCGDTGLDEDGEVRGRWAMVARLGKVEIQVESCIGNHRSPALDELVQMTFDKVTAIPMIMKDESEAASLCLLATNKNPKRLPTSQAPKG